MVLFSVRSQSLSSISIEALGFSCFSFTKFNVPARLLRAALWIGAGALCASTSLAGQGGGFTLAGVVGRYYTNTSGTGEPAFTRREPRLDFALSDLSPGGAGQAGDVRFRLVPAGKFSARWAGQIVPRFSETYTFTAFAKDSFLLTIRPVGSTNWSTVLAQTSSSGAANTGTVSLRAGEVYDVEAFLANRSGPWGARLLWSSASTPEEVIDPLVQSGINNPDWSAGFTDIVKGARNSWEGVNGGPRPAMDAEGWPMGDGAYVFQESLNQGLDVDPLMRGKVEFSFEGSATVSLQGNVRSGSLTYRYDAAANLTTGSFIVAENRWNASYFRFMNARRNGQPGGPPGIRNLRLMRPIAPDANTAYSPTNSLFTPQLLDAMSHFTVIRHQLVANQQRDWAERTLPGFFNQRGGTVSAPHYGVGEPSENGASWEHKILLANESGRDLMLSLPTVISGRTASDTNSYVWKLANLIRYGSDGREPYTSPVANPVYPPLNSNLRVYVEIENELWNWAGVFYTDFGNLNAITAADADAHNEDFAILNFDQLSTAKDASGNYVSMNTWRYRKIILRLVQISDIFRAVFGNDAMMSRIRPIYEWQYANDNDTARLALTFADRYFNNGDGQQHVNTPRPISHWLWGGGGATYYGAANGNGLTSLLPDPTFGTPALPSPGYHVAPTNSTWTFTGNAGIARDSGASDDVPPPYSGQQVAFLTDKSSASIRVTFPTNFTSPVFGVSFKAVNRRQAGASEADRQNIRVYLDGTNDITARTFSQGNGYTPPGYDAGHPWAANNVFWTWSEYYATKSFEVQPGSTHTITFEGKGDRSTPARTNQTVFLGEVRVTSVDRIFDDGMPGGGEATGQPIGQNIQRTMNVEATWAKAFGLEQVSYESGWSLGGDDGGSWVQLKAKYGDPRTAAVQARFMDMFHLAGSAVNVFGTYAQWPSWSDFFAEQGLLDVGKYPIIQGINDRASHLPPEPNNGVLVPAVLTPAMATISDRAETSQGRITAAGGWINWNVIAPRAGEYRLRVTSAGTNAQAVLLVNNVSLSSVSDTGAVVRLTKGLHSVKVRSISPATYQVRSVEVASARAPAAPLGVAVADGDRHALVSWQAVEGAVGYQIRFGTSPGAYSQVLELTNMTSFKVEGLTNGQPYFFTVVAVGAEGLSLPSREAGVVPLGPGQPGTLVSWEFFGSSGSEASAAAASASSRVRMTLLVRGTGLTPSQSGWAASMRANRFASEPSSAAGNSYGTSLAGAVTKKQYYEFTITPVAGQKLSLESLSFRAFFQNNAGGAGITYGIAGTNFSEPLPAAGSASSSQPWTVDLSSQAALQGVTKPVTVRIYLYGLGAYQVSGLGDNSGADIVLTGALSPLGSRLEIQRTSPQTLQLAWSTNSGASSLETKASLNPEVPWTPVGEPPRLSNAHWMITLPVDESVQFFRLRE